MAGYKFIEGDAKDVTLLKEALIGADYFIANAAMIGGAAHYRYIQGQRDGLGFDALPNWPLSEL